MDISTTLIAAAAELRDSTVHLRFGPPIGIVYHPLVYAWDLHAAYIRRYARAPKRVIFLGMNPGPFGMAQTGVPFGDVSMVRDWLKLCGTVGKPDCEHPRRPVTGLACARNEVSGRRLWGLFAHRFGSADTFFSEHFVVNYCPLVFMSETGANVTPDKLTAREARPLFAACDTHLRHVVLALQPEWVVGIGGFAAERAEAALSHLPIRLTRILHPSPASPAANRDWAGVVTRELIMAGIWR
jgi:single-strand selective monofunctional uracil DNA glycosylase